MKSPTKEGLKTVARSLIFLVFSWIVTETLKQVHLIPEYYIIKVSVLTYYIPFRDILLVLMAMSGSFLDKQLYQNTKNNPYRYGKPFGIIPF